MKNSTREMLLKFGIRPSKSLGQNFLTDDSVVSKIVDSAEIGKDDLVVEIGPGLGTMTAELASRAGWVVAVEIDRHLIPVLKKSLEEYENISLINKDVLKVDFKKEILDFTEDKMNGFRPQKIKVVANLPYYITTPVIMKLLEDEIPADLMVFMVQKEVADRMAAAPGGKDYGALSVAVQYYSAPEKVFNVPPHCFIPQPGVDSSVIRLRMHKTPPVFLKNKDLFFKVVKAAFGQRRKTLPNALSNSGFFGLPKDQIIELIKGQGIEENRRGETLSILQFAELSNSFFDFVK
jgi:16S rRNA (adenine1518-N6/adenine1519-N6)-dimethyltransferase